MDKKKTVIILVGIAVIAFVLRWYLLPSHLFFGPEQGRDILVVRDIVINHKLTLIGSKTDINGIFHGPVFYYLAAIPFAISYGDPLSIIGFFVLIQSLTVFLVYILVYEFTGHRRTGYLAAGLFAISYQFIVYARWLSNPPLSIPLSLVYIYSLLRFVRGRSHYLMAVALSYGLLGQAEFINFVLFGAVGLLTCIYFIDKIRHTKPYVWLISLVVALVTSIGTYILFDLRHNFLISNGVLGLLQGKSGFQVDLITSIGGAFRVFFDQAAAMIGAWTWQHGLGIFVLIAIGIYMQFRKNKSYILIAFWIIAPPIIFALLRRGMLEQLYAGIIAGILIGLAVSIDWILSKNRIVGYTCCVVLVITNICALAISLPSNSHVFFEQQQRGVRYSDQLASIDWIYYHAGGKPFSFQSYTIPYYLQDAWTYLLWYYGERKYGYGPDNRGRSLMFVVIQKDRLDPNFQKKWYEDTFPAWGAVTAHTNIGDYTIEERTL